MSRPLRQPTEKPSDRMNLVVYNKSTAYEPQMATVVHLTGRDSGYAQARRNPAEYLAARANPGAIGAPKFPRSDIRRYRELRDGLRSKGMSEQTVRQTLEAFVKDSDVAGILEALDADSPDLDEGSIRALFGGDDHRILRAALEVVEAEYATSRPTRRRLSEDAAQDPEQATNLATVRRLGFRDLVYVEDFPMLMMNIGYRRYNNNQDKPFARTRTYPRIGVGRNKIPVYAEAYQTEAIVFEVDPARAASWSEEWTGAALPGRGSVLPGFVAAVEASQHIAEARDCDERGGENSHGHALWTLLHSLSHAAIKACAGLSGFNSTTLAEHVMPGALRFAVVVNKQNELNIGGLHSVYEDLLGTLLGRFEDAMRDCIQDPACSEASLGQCHACITISETSCRHYNSHLGRKTIYGDSSSVAARRGYFS